jgi:hypothetical protein
MDQNHSVGVEYLVEDSKVTDAKPKKLVVRTLNRLYKLARRAGICAQTINRSLDPLAVGLRCALEGSSCGS